MLQPHHRPLPMFTSIALLLTLAAASLAATAAPTPASAHLRLATYNVKDLFDVFDNPYTADQLVKPKPRAQIQAVANAIKALHADVVAVTEVENEGVLRAMVHQFLPDMGYHYVAVASSNSPTGGSDGILSRLPITRISSYRFRKLHLPGYRKTWHFIRNLMQVDLAAGNHKTLHLFIVHFKARRNSPGDPKSNHWRLAEATETRRIVTSLFHRSPSSQPWIAVLGDFNATPDAKPVHVLLDQTAPAPLQLFDVHANLPPAQRITYLKPPFRSTIDYILVSHALQQRLIPHSATVMHKPQLLTGSDHAPIAASFNLASHK